MQWVLIFLYVYSITLSAGVEVVPAPITPPPLPTIKAIQVNNADKTTSINSLLSKTTSANTTTSLNSLAVKLDVTSPPDLRNSLASLTDVKTNVASTKSLVEKIPCTCGVFLSGQFVAGSGKQPEGSPPLLQEYDVPMPCTPAGHRQCANKCLEVIAKHLRNSATIICGSLDRDCFKERAYLWTKNCNDVWENSHMSAGREYCCKDGLPYKCALGKS